MCEVCAKAEEKTVLLEIKNVHESPGAKLDAGLDALSKALGYDSTVQQKEISPFKSVRNLEKISKDHVEQGLLNLWGAIRSTWLQLEKAKGTDAFVLSNRIFINPKTGKALTNAQWAIIKKDVLKAFDYLYAVEEERIAAHAMSLGKVLKGMPLGNSLSYGYKTLQNKVKNAMSKMYDPQYQNALAIAQQEAGAMIVELKQKQYKQIHSVIQTGIKHRQSSSELVESLYDRFGNMNRDWRRIAETEIGNAQNNAQLLTELGRRKDDEEYIFMKGLSSSEACVWCRNEVNNKIVVLLEAPPDTGGDSIIVDGETYTAIWPGKSNYGRNRANWWIAAGTQHPFCRCTWVKHVPGFEKWDDMITAALDQAMAEGAKKSSLQATQWG